MPGDYIPAPDAQFDLWQATFVTYANANLVNLGLVAGDMTPVTAAQTAWGTAYPAHLNAQNTALALRQTKDQRRAEYVATIRPLVNRLQASSAVSNEERAALGITVPDPVSTPVPIPTTKPVAQIDTRQRLQHTIGFADEGTPTSKAKPFGVMGAEIWVAILAAGATPPGDPSAFTFLTVDTRTPHTTDFDGGDGGKTAHYILRWVNSRGQKGPWSETVSATIGA